MATPTASGWLMLRSIAFALIALGILIGLVSITNNLFIKRPMLNITNMLTMIFGLSGFALLVVFGIGRALGFAPPPPIKRS